MDVVVLPMVWPDTKVNVALEMLQAHRRAGVVRQDLNDTYRLLFAGDLLRARAAGVSVAGEVEGGRPIFLVDSSTATAFNADLIRPRRTWAAYEQMLDALDAHYGLVGETGNEAMIVTRHEDETVALSTTGGFECTGRPTHYFPEPRVSVGEVCPLFPECSRSDGTTPTIRPA